MHDNVVAYTAHEKGKGKDMRQVQCYSYKEYDHIVVNYSTESSNYCKKSGYIINECPTCPQNHQTIQAVVAKQPVIGFTTSDKSILTLDMVQQMIIMAFSTLELQGKHTTPILS